MRKLTSDRGTGVASKTEKRYQNSGNELKDLLEAKDLALFGAKNELVFERKNAQTNPKMRPKKRKMEAGKWKLED